MKFVYRILCICFFSVFCFTHPNNVVDENPLSVELILEEIKSTDPTIQGIYSMAKQVFVVDYESDAVLLSKNHDQKMSPSSMTKIMVLYIIFSALKNNKIVLDDMLMVSKNAWSQEGSRMFLEVGKTVSVRDLICGISVSSGNDATVTIAEGLYGGEEIMASVMNDQAKSLDMNNTSFSNTSGLPDPSVHYSTAEDICKLSIALFRDFKEYYTEFCGMTTFTYNNIRQPNINPGLAYGADGIKTGCTKVGGYGVSCSIDIQFPNQNRRIFIVINGCETEKDRKECIRRIISYCKSRLTTISVLKKGTKICNVNVLNGKKDNVAVYINEDLDIIIDKLHLVQLKQKLKCNLDEYVKEKIISIIKPINAPIKMGSNVGVVSIDLFGKNIYLYSADEVQKKSEVMIMFSSLKKKIINSIRGMFN
ncbi:D-alanyl-D-alanine carboxypeptidase family protein [Candidatus Gromoviella agglomerans]|uniref:D-alanyl-D-alanine carboxypeptidase family protein n=1 Tax=Candidatus Gromoviella agglomerans TaxID=2806609 RepID=UPI001E45250E|nr:D-alanyl-D-alanine carboxypeptidase family protein [Candidatus Gromoviella agglomerans]UFX98147.1 D-alanyl-D-alanine carboxypeptidase [Candidatus Gromoviella agglomerans]